jgi:hypothetical protein
VIEIKNMHVAYDADVQGDEAVFARLFARETACYDDERDRAASAEASAAGERALSEGRAAW